MRACCGGPFPNPKRVTSGMGVNRPQSRKVSSVSVVAESLGDNFLVENRTLSLSGDWYLPRKTHLPVFCFIDRIVTRYGITECETMCFSLAIHARRNTEPEPETPHELGEISEAGSERNIKNASRGH